MRFGGGNLGYEPLLSFIFYSSPPKTSVNSNQTARTVRLRISISATTGRLPVVSFLTQKTGLEN
jgi:hypothetical protein